MIIKNNSNSDSSRSVIPHNAFYERVSLRQLDESDYQDINAVVESIKEDFPNAPTDKMKEVATTLYKVLEQQKKILV